MKKILDFLNKYIVTKLHFWSTIISLLVFIYLNKDKFNFKDFNLFVDKCISVKDLKLNCINNNILLLTLDENSTINTNDIYGYEVNMIEKDKPIEDTNLCVNLVWKLREDTDVKVETILFKTIRYLYNFNQYNYTDYQAESITVFINNDTFLLNNIYKNTDITMCFDSNITVKKSYDIFQPQNELIYNEIKDKIVIITKQIRIFNNWIGFKNSTDKSSGEYLFEMLYNINNKYIPEKFRKPINLNDFIILDYSDNNDFDYVIKIIEKLKKDYNSKLIIVYTEFKKINMESIIPLIVFIICGIWLIIREKLLKKIQKCLSAKIKRILKKENNNLKEKTKNSNFNSNNDNKTKIEIENKTSDLTENEKFNFLNIENLNISQNQIPLNKIPDYIDYLKNTFFENELKDIANKLNIPIQDEIGRNKGCDEYARYIIDYVYKKQDLKELVEILKNLNKLKNKEK